MGLFDFLSGGDKESSQTTTAEAAPWGPQQDYLKEIFGEAQKQYQSGAPQYYPGQTVAGFTAPEQQAQQQLLDYAGGGAKQVVGQSQDALAFALRDMLNPGSNVALQQHVRGAIDPAVEALTREVLPQVRSGAQVAGQYGGTRQDLAESIAIDKMMENILNTSGGIMSNAYQTSLDNFMQGIQMSPSIGQFGTLPSTLTSTVGETQRGMEQAQIDANVARHNFEQQAPAAALANYLNMVQGNYGGTSTQTATTQQEGGGGLMDMLGLGAKVASFAVPGGGTIGGSIFSSLF